MKALTVDLTDLDPAPRNANVLPPAQYDRLVESIRRVGFAQPILVRPLAGGRYELVDGHHRTRAMRELGEPTIPAVVLEGNEDPRLVALAMNRLRGETDLAIAGLIIEDLIDDGVLADALSISGFSESELNDLVSAMQSSEPSLDDMDLGGQPEAPPDQVAKPFLLELTFTCREDLALVKKALRKAVGRGGDLADGLLRLINAE